jgi:hypothetical protein
MSAIVDFLEGDGLDGAGRRHAQILSFGLGALESHHDFIQWLFPLTEASEAVPGSPVLSPEDVAALRASTVAQGRLAAAAERMAVFYETTDHWLRPSDHNHRRISRIIKSLRLLCGDLAAVQFRRRILMRVASRNAPVSEVSQRYWAQA